MGDALVQEGYPADALHGDLSQAQRDLVMGKFRQQSIRLLVATDVAARGPDGMRSPISSTTTCPMIPIYTPIAAVEPRRPGNRASPSP